MMKKIQFYVPGDIHVEEAEIPVSKVREIVIRDEVTLTCGTDMKTHKHGYRYEPPFGMGYEVGGVVHVVGEGITGLIAGDRVVIHNSVSCGACCYHKRGQESTHVNLIQNQSTNGAYAEYQLALERIVKLNTFHIPERMSYKQAALLEPLAYALYGTEVMSLDLGDYVHVNGCGSIGLMFIRTYVLRGAYVIAHDMTPERLALTEKLDAQEIINIRDLSGKSQAEAVKELTPDVCGVDAAIEATGLPEVRQTVPRITKPGGEILFLGSTEKGLEVSMDITLVHYPQLTPKDVFHTTLQHIDVVFEMLRMGAVSAKGFIQDEYCVEDAEKAIVEHASGEITKNYTVYK